MGKKRKMSYSFNMALNKNQLATTQRSFSNLSLFYYYCLIVSIILLRFTSILLYFKGYKINKNK